MATHHRWIKPIARGGYAARGVVYLIVGFLAVLAGLGSGEKTDAKGAITELFQSPFGTALTWVLIVGLLGYVMWRLIQSLLDTDDHGWSPKGIAVRIGLLASAATYTTLALYALSLLGVLGGGGQSEERGAVGDFIAGFVSLNVISAVLAAIFFGVAVSHWYKAFTQKYQDHFQASSGAMTIIDPVSMTGLTARGIVFAVISLLLFYRSFTAGGSPTTPPGIKDAMNYIQGLPAGGWLLALLGVGIVCFSAYSFIEAVWRRINVEDADGPVGG